MKTRMCLLMLACAWMTGCTRPVPPVVVTKTTTTTAQQPSGVVETHAVMVEPDAPAAPAGVRVRTSGGGAPPPIQVVEVPTPAAAPPPVAAPVVVTAPTPGVMVQLSVASPTPTPVPSPSPTPLPSPLVFPGESMQDVPLPTDDLPFASPRPNVPTRTDMVDRVAPPTDALPGGSP